MYIENQIDGTVCGRPVPLSWLTPGKDAGSRQDAHEFMALRKVETPRYRVVGDVDAFSTTVDEPLVDTDFSVPPWLQAPAIDRNRCTSEIEIVDSQRETGDVPSSFSVTGCR